MICFVIVFSFVTLIFLEHKEYAHAHTHTHTNAADINTCVCVCVCVWEYLGVRAGVCLYVYCTAVHRWLGFYYVYTKQL